MTNMYTTINFHEALSLESRVKQAAPGGDPLVVDSMLAIMMEIIYEYEEEAGRIKDNLQDEVDYAVSAIERKHKDMRWMRHLLKQAVEGGVSESLGEAISNCLTATQYCEE